MEAVNLHLTGDFHAVTSAHNLLAAMVDNHLHHGNELDIDVRTHRLATGARRQRPGPAPHRRRARRAHATASPAQAGFDITAASEVMVILSLATSLRDLRERLGRIVVGFTTAGAPVTAEDLKAAGAMAVLLRDAIKPNLLQTLEHTPALIHAGPFGNIATGNSSVVADLLGIRAADYLLTEAGFGADMGAERFFDVKCRVSGPAAGRGRRWWSPCAPSRLHSGRFRVVAGQAAATGDARGEPGRRPGRWRQPAGATSRSCGGSASRRWWRSTPSPATTSRSTT